MQDYEKLGVFYLGRQYDLPAQKARDELLLYDAKDLTTHAVCVGMTGSGKTGLCLAFLEEAAIDGIPAIAIDPKGDLGNLLLAFPGLTAEEFRPWIDPDEAQRKGLSAEQFAAATAEGYRKGLADWGQDPSRIARFRDAVDAAIYTPGSNAGLPLTVLRSFSAPSAALVADGDAMRERVAAAVAGLLALVGVAGDPLRSREHILLSNIVDRAWREGRDLDMGRLIREVQTPPFDRLGIMDLESFFPAKERFELAMSLNNLLASPGFAAWMQGEPLDIQRLLHTPQGKPRLSILSIAHLSDAERMFFVTILLNEVIAWMRAQPGTSSLRAILYMDEVFGYFPPTANPPSKSPMLTLLKQARAFGLGIVLATQNPVDLDYKGLSNAGTWFLGRLQTERDKMRVLEGLESAVAGAGKNFDRSQIEAALSSLGNRVFLMNNVHEDHPTVFQTRWVLSYLRGPLTRGHIQVLMQARKAASAAPSIAAATAAPATAPASTPAPVPAAATVAAASPVAAQGGVRPMLPPGISEGFVCSRVKVPAGKALVYRPALLGSAKVHFAQASADVDAWQDVVLLAQVEGDVDAEGIWESVQARDTAPDLDPQPAEGAAFANLPGELARVKRYAELAAGLKSFLYRTQAISLPRCASLKLTAKPGESEGDFRVRIRHAVAERRDQAVEKLRATYAPKLAALQEQIRRGQQKIVKERAEANEHTFTAAVSLGTSILGALLGRKLASASNLNRAASTARAATRVAKERSQVGAAEENVEAVQGRLTALDAEFKDETEKLRQSLDPDTLVLDSVEVKPKKTDITIGGVQLVWTPWHAAPDGSLVPAGSP